MTAQPDIRIKAAALDLDGTIIGPDELVTPRVKDAVQRLSARIPVFIATGREPQDVFEYAEQLGLTGPQLSDGGAAILDPVGRRHIWSANLGPDLAPEVLGLVEQLDAHFVATHVQGTFRRVIDIPNWDIVRISALDLSRESAEALVARFREHPRMSVILASRSAVQRALGGGLHAVGGGQGQRRGGRRRTAYAMGEMLGMMPADIRETGLHGLRRGQLQRPGPLGHHRPLHEAGRPAKVLLYGCGLHEDIAYRVLAANNTPDLPDPKGPSGGLGGAGPAW